MNHVTQLVAVVIGLALLGSIPAVAQESGAAQTRRILDEAQAHEEAERYAIAAQRYLQLYDVMREAQLQRAPVALWSAGFCLSHLPGRERDARDALRRFLEASTALAQQAADIQRYRSESISILGELDARHPTAQNLDEPDGASAGSAAQESDGSGSISPVGPILLGIGGAALIPGLITTGVAYGQDQGLITRCPTRMDCDPGTRSDAESARALGLAGDALWVIGASIALVRGNNRGRRRLSRLESPVTRVRAALAVFALLLTQACHLTFATFDDRNERDAGGPLDSGADVGRVDGGLADGGPTDGGGRRWLHRRWVRRSQRTLRWPRQRLRRCRR